MSIVLCCVVWLIIITIYLYAVRDKSSFYPERVNICEEAKRNHEVPCNSPMKQCSVLWDYNLGNSLNVRIDSDCKIRDPDLVVNPLTMVYSNNPLRFMFENQLFSLWQENRGYMVEDETGLEIYDPSCVNVGLSKSNCKVDNSIQYKGNPVSELHLGDCINDQMKECARSKNKSFERFTSVPHNSTEARLVRGQGVLENDVRFPIPIPGAPSDDAEYSGLNTAGNGLDIGFMPTAIKDGKFFTEDVELMNRLRNFDNKLGI